VAEQRLYEWNLLTGQTQELLAPADVLKKGEEKPSPEEKARRERMRINVGGFTDFQLSEDGQRVLVSLSDKLYVVDRQNGSKLELSIRPGTILDPKLSPDGKRVAYVRDFDVYVYDLSSGEEVAVTKGGTRRKTYGLAEFVAQEEMGRHSGYWWAPDSQLLAIEEADHEEVEIWYIADPAKPDQSPMAQYYPRPGKTNVRTRLGIFAVKGGEPVWVEWGAQDFEYLAAVHWDLAGPLTVTLQDRKQQQLILLRVDPASGKTTLLLTERSSNWINLHQEVPVWLSHSQRFLFILNRSENEELHSCPADGGEIFQVAPLQDGGSPGEYFAGLMHFNRDSRLAHYRITTGVGAEAVRSVLLGTDGQPEEDKEAASPHVLGGAFSRDGSVAVFTRTSLEEMPFSIVRSQGGGKPGRLPSVAVEPGFRPNVVIETVGSTEGYPTAVVRPRDFDPGNRYPVIVQVYGGPRHQTVVQAMSRWLLPQWLADQGFVVASIDNRGTPGRGGKWEMAIYQKFGTVPLEDQIQGLQLLGQKYSEMDLDRVGIVGWSFGGYLSALAALKHPAVFKAAVAGAPVTEWRDYDTHYTERYLGLLPEDESIYTEASLLPLAARLERPLLLVHGTADDNVYSRHSLRLADALFRAGKEFELMLLPSLTHMVYEPIATERLWTAIARYFKRHLSEPRCRE
jgi:dipeptidyl-peptidase-4